MSTCEIDWDFDIKSRLGVISSKKLHKKKMYLDGKQIRLDISYVLPRGLTTTFRDLNIKGAVNSDILFTVTKKNENYFYHKGSKIIQLFTDRGAKFIGCKYENGEVLYCKRKTTWGVMRPILEFRYDSQIVASSYISSSRNKTIFSIEKTMDLDLILLICMSIVKELEIAVLSD